MTTKPKEIPNKPDAITVDLNYIKKHIKDIAMVLADDDLEALQEAESDHKLGNTKRL